MTTTSHTHALINHIGKAIATGNQADVTAQATGGDRVVELAATSVGVLARIAAEDYPAMLKTGTGPLGAGTHPAAPYLSRMLGLNDTTRDNVKDVWVGYDRADHVALYFLENASAWRGPVARAVKDALRSMIR